MPLKAKKKGPRCSEHNILMQQFFFYHEKCTHYSSVQQSTLPDPIKNLLG